MCVILFECFFWGGGTGDLGVVLLMERFVEFVDGFLVSLCGAQSVLRSSWCGDLKKVCRV